MPSMPASSFLRRLVPCLFVTSGLSVAACGVDDRILNAGGDASPGDGTLDTAVSRFALATCDRMNKCAPAYVRSTFGSYDECVTRTVLVNKWAGGLPGVTWDAKMFLNCATRWNNTSCDEIFSADPYPECRSLGTRGQGEGCNLNNQCATNYCDQVGYSCGKCAPEPAEGAACTNSQQCAEGMWCMPDSTCHKPAKRGQPCSSTLSCATDSICVSGTCAARVQEGGHCDTSAGLYCDFNGKELLCGSTSSACVAVTAKQAGESCATQSYCEKSGMCSNGTCQPAAGDTGSCDDAAGPYCEWPALCVNGSCQLPTSVTLCAG